MSAKKLQEQQNKDTPIELIMKLMELILYNNIFSFHDALWKQNIGAAMGSKPVPPYANIFMARIDQKIKDLAKQYDEGDKNALILMKRFLDDIFLIFNGTTRNLHELLHKINQINPNIKLTMMHTTVPGEALEDKCECETREAIPYLDTLCSIQNGKIDTDLYIKPTDQNQYLLPESCHPKQTTRAIPKSLGLRIVRICSNPDKRDLRLNELKERLIQRGYNESMVQSSLNKVKKIPRNLALKRVKKDTQNEKRPVYAVTYDPRLPSISSLQAKHWRAMTSRNKYLSEVFPNPPLTAYKRQPNLRSIIIRAAVAKSNRYPTRNQRGMNKCNRQNCTSCAYILEAKGVKINGVSWKINKKLNCNNYNIVYGIICKKDKCKEVYIGETKRQLKFCLSDHRGYIVNKNTNTATGHHFNLPGHSLADLSVIVIEQVKKNYTLYRKEREEFHIRRFNTLYKGMNKKI